MKAPDLGKFLFFFPLTMEFFLFLPKEAFAQNLLQNPGFEQGTLGWNKWGSGSLEITSESRSGNWAGKFSISGTTTATFVYQVIPVAAGQSYRFLGFAKLTDGNGDIYLKVSFYSSADGSGSELSNVTSGKVANPSEYSSLAIDSFEVPSGANSVKAKVYLDPQAESKTVAYLDDFNFEQTQTLSPTSTPTNIPVPTNTPAPTPTPAPQKATYKINKVKDSGGNTVTNVKIYVDGLYIHHYAPEELTFCDGCKCDTDVDCSFGQHTIKLEKSGYQDWSETKMISAGASYEVNPVMNKLISTLTATPTSKLTSLPTSTPKPISSLSPSFPTSTLDEPATESVMGTIAGQVTLSGELISPTATPAPKFRKVLGGIFLSLGGLAILGATVFLLKTRPHFK